MPKTVKEPYAIDEKNGNTLWQDAMQEEMENMKIALTIPEGEKPCIGFQYVNCHMVFDIKMEDFQRKLFQCRKTVCIALTMAVLHDLEVTATDVLNTHVMAPNFKKIWAVLGQKFGTMLVNLP